MQAGEVIDAFERRKRDISDLKNGEVLEWLNFIEDYCYERFKYLDTRKFSLVVEFEVSSDPQSFDLPEDFQDMTPYDCGLYAIDNYGRRKDELIQSDNYGYDLGFDSITIFGLISHCS